MKKTIKEYLVKDIVYGRSSLVAQQVDNMIFNACQSKFGVSKEQITKNFIEKNKLVVVHQGDRTWLEAAGEKISGVVEVMYE